ncbi:uncharacterized protein LOC111748920 [Loxodonta africana]|uniref:uncharacterized protein LOC111748920 n=1 Tax=Loxodonta africana TaxID=9785 RepID=UPI000C81442E|nr:uncharacterized protein LOC111748920 [Loxodonta africana]
MPGRWRWPRDMPPARKLLSLLLLILMGTELTQVRASNAIFLPASGAGPALGSQVRERLRARARPRAPCPEAGPGGPRGVMESAMAKPLAISQIDQPTQLPSSHGPSMANPHWAQLPWRLFEAVDQVGDCGDPAGVHGRMRLWPLELQIQEEKGQPALGAPAAPDPPSLLPSLLPAYLPLRIKEETKERRRGGKGARGRSKKRKLWGRLPLFCPEALAGSLAQPQEHSPSPGVWEGLC